MRRVTYLVPLLLIPVSAAAMVMRQPHPCPMIAKLCPDGSSVSPTGPNCEFAPCPGGGQPGETKPAPAPVPPSGSGSAGTGTTGPGVISSPPAEGSEDGNEGAPTVPGSTGQQTMESVPDMPLDAPKEAQSVKFVIEHRSALNGQHLTVHGVIVAANPADKACTPGKECGDISITLADAPDDGRNKTYDLTINLPRNDKTPYAQGQIVDVSGTVTGAEDSVMMQKE